MTLFAYFGPETLMPLTSIVAAVAGVFLMFGKNTLRLIAGLFRGLGRTVRRESSVPTPHVASEGSSALERRRARARDAATSEQADGR